MVSSGVIEKIEYVQVQFHDFVNEAPSKRQESLASIGKTHDPIYSFPFVWEGFQKRITRTAEEVHT
jgi:hypothetical protein